MLGWLGFLAKMLTFTVEKITGKAIELKMDDRRRAARRLMGLYHALLDLEVLTQEISLELKQVVGVEDPAIQAKWVHDVSIAVGETSQRFLEATLGLKEILQIFDPVLASTVSDLEASKFSSLMLAAQGFEPEGKSPNYDGIKYSFPKIELETLDLDQYYLWYKEHYPLDSRTSGSWPNWVIFGYVEESDVREDRVLLTDGHSAGRLISMLTRHLVRIAAARKQLAEFLSKHFTFQDLLAVVGGFRDFVLGQDFAILPDHNGPSFRGYTAYQC